MSKEDLIPFKKARVEISLVGLKEVRIEAQ